MSEGIIGTTTWEACEACENNKPDVGCIVPPEDLEIDIHIGKFFICLSYTRGYAGYSAENQAYKPNQP